MQIRPLESSDKIPIHQILTDTKFFTREEIKIAMELIDDYLNNPSTTYKIYVMAYKLSSEIAGYTCFGKAPMSHSTYDLYWIAVNPHAQKKGIGKSLMKFVETEVMKDHGNQILLETASKSSYDSTRKFYESLGYQKIGSVDDYYAPGDSKIIYLKKLGSGS